MIATRQSVPTGVTILVAGCFATAASMGVRATMGLYLDPISDGLSITTIQRMESVLARDFSNGARSLAH
ncbi:MAG: hypothetical protein VYB10_02880 [Actinomycetota bacterium]|nr:hypothetical protein [Actinomycetota bacterium]